jgi:light-regulated signal transduction histidine kinase (bacteriophytochrome)
MNSKPIAPGVEVSRQEAIEARALVSALTELSSRAGHELVGPLNQAASLLALLIKRYRNHIDSNADQLLEYLQSASTRMEWVVEGIREYFKIAGRSPQLETVDLNASLASSLTLLEESILESGAVIESESLPSVTADATHMAAIFKILIGNAIKFRKPDAAPRILVSSRQEGKIQTVSIEDNGIGIAPEFAETGFLPFERLNGREYPGVGLGLAAAKLITEVHGGTIRIESVPDAGTRVRFSLCPL